MSRLFLPKHQLHVLIYFHVVVFGVKLSINFTPGLFIFTCCFFLICFHSITFKLGVLSIVVGKNYNVEFSCPREILTNLIKISVENSFKFIVFDNYLYSCIVYEILQNMYSQVLHFCLLTNILLLLLLILLSVRCLVTWENSSSLRTRRVFHFEGGESFLFHVKLSTYELQRLPDNI